MTIIVIIIIFMFTNDVTMIPKSINPIIVLHQVFTKSSILSQDKRICVQSTNVPKFLMVTETVELFENKTTFKITVTHYTFSSRLKS